MSAINERVPRYDARGNGMCRTGTSIRSSRLTPGLPISRRSSMRSASSASRSLGSPPAAPWPSPTRCAARNVCHTLFYMGRSRLAERSALQPLKKERDAMTTLMRLGWGADNPAFRQMFTGLFIPGATHEQADVFNKLQRKTTSPECAVRYFEAVNDFDIIDLLSKVEAADAGRAHPGRPRCVPMEAGRQLAAGIPGARFIALPGRNHLFLEHEPASSSISSRRSVFF